MSAIDPNIKSSVLVSSEGDPPPPNHTAIVPAQRDELLDVTHVGRTSIEILTGLLHGDKLEARIVRSPLQEKVINPFRKMIKKIPTALYVSIEKFITDHLLPEIADTKEKLKADPRQKKELQSLEELEKVIQLLIRTFEESEKSEPRFLMSLNLHRQVSSAQPQIEGLKKNLKFYTEGKSLDENLKITLDRFIAFGSYSVLKNPAFTLIERVRATLLTVMYFSELETGSQWKLLDNKQYHSQAVEKVKPLVNLYLQMKELLESYEKNSEEFKAFLAQYGYQKVSVLREIDSIKNDFEELKNKLKPESLLSFVNSPFDGNLQKIFDIEALLKVDLLPSSLRFIVLDFNQYTKKVVNNKKIINQFSWMTSFSQEIADLLASYEEKIKKWRSLAYSYSVEGIPSKDEGKYLGSVLYHSVRKHETIYETANKDLNTLKHDAGVYHEKKETINSRVQELKDKLELSLAEIESLQERGIDILVQKGRHFWENKDKIFKEFKDLLSADFDTRFRLDFSREDSILKRLKKIYNFSLTYSPIINYGFEWSEFERGRYISDTLRGQNPSALPSAQDIMTEIQSLLPTYTFKTKAVKKAIYKLMMLEDALDIDQEDKKNIFSKKLNGVVKNILHHGEKIFLYVQSANQEYQFLEWHEATQSFEVKINFGKFEPSFYRDILEDYLVYYKNNETFIYPLHGETSAPIHHVSGTPHAFKEENPDFLIGTTYSNSIAVPNRRYPAHFWNIICIDKKTNKVFQIENIRWTKWEGYYELSDIEASISKQGSVYLIKGWRLYDTDSLDQNVSLLVPDQKNGFNLISILDSKSYEEEENDLLLIHGNNGHLHVIGKGRIPLYEVISNVSSLEETPKKAQITLTDGSSFQGANFRVALNKIFERNESSGSSGNSGPSRLSSLIVAAGLTSMPVHESSLAYNSIATSGNVFVQKGKTSVKKVPPLGMRMKPLFKSSMTKNVFQLGRNR